MALGEKYYAEKTSDLGDVVRVELWFEGFGGTATEHILMEPGVLPDYEGPGERDVYKPVLTASCEAHFRDDGTLDADLHGIGMRDAQMRVFSGSTEVFRGWIVPKQDRRHLNYPGSDDVTQISARCGLSDLKDMPFVDASGDFWSDRVTLKTVLARCLEKTDLGVGFATCSNWFTPAMVGTDDPLDQVYVNTRGLRDAEGDLPVSVLDVLTMALKVHHLTLRQSVGPRWYIQQRDRIADATVDHFVYNPGGSFVTKETGTLRVTVSENGAAALRPLTDRQPTFMGLKSASVVFGHGEPPNLIRNPYFGSQTQSGLPEQEGIFVRARGGGARRGVIIEDPGPRGWNAKFGGQFNRPPRASTYKGDWKYFNGTSQVDPDILGPFADHTGNSAIAGYRWVDDAFADPFTDLERYLVNQNGVLYQGGTGQAIQYSVSAFVVVDPGFAESTIEDELRFPVYYQIILVDPDTNAEMHWLDEDMSWQGTAQRIRMGERPASMTIGNLGQWGVPGDGHWYTESDTSDDLPAGIWEVRVKLWEAADITPEERLDNLLWTSIIFAPVIDGFLAPASTSASAADPNSTHRLTLQQDVLLGDAPVVGMLTSLTHSDKSPTEDWKRGAYGVGEPESDKKLHELLAEELYLEQADNIPIHESGYLKEFPRVWPHQVLYLEGMAYQVGSVQYDLLRGRQRGSYPQLARSSRSVTKTEIELDGQFTSFTGLASSLSRGNIELAEKISLRVKRGEVLSELNIEFDNINVDTYLLKSANFDGVIDATNPLAVSITNAGTLGWAIANSGDAAFNNVLIRGAVISDSTIDGFDTDEFAKLADDEAITGLWAFSQNPAIAGGTNWYSGNDGAGSGMDSDLLDGQHGSHYAALSEAETITGEWNYTTAPRFTAGINRPDNAGVAISPGNGINTLYGTLALYDVTGTTQIGGLNNTTGDFTLHEGQLSLNDQIRDDAINLFGNVYTIGIRSGTWFALSNHRFRLETAEAATGNLFEVGNTSAANFFHIEEAGHAVFSHNVGSPDFVSRTTGWRVTGPGQADFRGIYADELTVQAFTADVAQALVGSEYLTKSRGVLSRSFTVPAVSSTAFLYVEDLEELGALPVFEDGGTIRLRYISRADGGLIVADVWGTVASYVDQGGGEQRWTFTTRQTSVAGETIYQGSVALDYGTSGSGMIVSTVLDAQGSPYTQFQTWTDTNADHVPDAYQVLTRIGVLEGITDADLGGALTGAGLYGTNVYLKGKVVATSGYIGSTTQGWTITASNINNGNVFIGSSVSALADPNRILIGFWNPADLPIIIAYGDATDTFISMRSDASWGLRGDVGGVRVFEVNADGLYINGGGTFTGALSAATGTFAGSLSAATGTFAGSLSAATGTFAGSLTAATGSFAGSLTAATGSFSGQVTALTGELVDLDVTGVLTMGAGGEITNAGGDYSITSAGISAGTGKILLDNEGIKIDIGDYNALAFRSGSTVMARLRGHVNGLQLIGLNGGRGEFIANLAPTVYDSGNSPTVDITGPPIVYSHFLISPNTWELRVKFPNGQVRTLATD
jgi:hypothetical protein